MQPSVEGVQREATYYEGSRTNTLHFVYVPQPGDHSAIDGLDYYVDRASLNSAAASFKLNGGSVMLSSDSPIVDASVHLNPPGGNIKGKVSVIATAGICSYLDLAIKRRGLDYNLIFETYIPENSRAISTQQTVFVSFSNEFELRGGEALVGDLGGESVNFGQLRCSRSAWFKHQCGNYPDSDYTKQVSAVGAHKVHPVSWHTSGPAASNNVFPFNSRCGRDIEW